MLHVSSQRARKKRRATSGEGHARIPHKLKPHWRPTVAETALKITRMSPRKFVVEIPGGGHCGDLSEAEARGYAMGFIRGVGWAKSQIWLPDGIVGPDNG